MTRRFRCGAMGSMVLLIGIGLVAQAGAHTHVFRNCSRNTRRESLGLLVAAVAVLMKHLLPAIRLCGLGLPPRILRIRLTGRVIRLAHGHGRRQQQASQHHLFNAFHLCSMPPYFSSLAVQHFLEARDNRSPSRRAGVFKQAAEFARRGLNSA